MTDKIIIHCDECGSTDVLHEEVREAPREVHKTMSDVIASNSRAFISHDVYTYRTYRLVCKECGLIKKYQV